MSIEEACNRVLSPSLAASKCHTFSASIDSEADCAGLSAALVTCVTALASVPEEEIRVIISAYMYNADKDYGKGVAKLANAPMAKVRQTAKDLMEQQAARAAKAKQVAESLTALMQ